MKNPLATEVLARRADAEARGVVLPALEAGWTQTIGDNRERYDKKIEVASTTYREAKTDRCDVDDCETFLNIYNPHTYCGRCASMGRADKVKAADVDTILARLDA